jgi:hypothetical protein
MTRSKATRGPKHDVKPYARHQAEPFVDIPFFSGDTAHPDAQESKQVFNHKPEDHKPNANSDPKHKSGTTRSKGDDNRKNTNKG